MEDGHVITVGLGREVLDGIVGDARRLRSHTIDAAHAAPLTRHLVDLTSSTGLPFDN